MSLRTKIILVFLSLSLVCSGSVLAIFLSNKHNFQRDALNRVADYASTTNEIIDRNLFERYGDVQAFAQNHAAYIPANWKNPSDSNPLIASINSYMTNYGIYRLSVLLNTEGEVLAVNSVDSKGKPIDTAKLYEQNFSAEPWFKNPLTGTFLAGRNGLTGTFVEGPYKEAAVAGVFGDDARVVVFSAAVRNSEGKLIGIWANFADFGLVEQIIGATHQRLQEKGLGKTAIQLLDSKGVVLVDYDPAAHGGTYGRDYAVIDKQNLATEGVTAATKVLESKQAGAELAYNDQKKVEEVNGYSYSTGAYDYPGLGWSVLVRADQDEIFAAVEDAAGSMVKSTVVLQVIVFVLSLLLASLIARRIARFIGTIEKIADGETDIVLHGMDGRDEISRLMRATETLRGNVEDAYMLKQMVQDMSINVILADVSDDCKISYMNQAAITTFTALEDVLPVKVAHMIGKSIDVLSRPPENLLRLIADPKNLPYRTRIQLGSETLELLVAAIRNKKGEYTQAILTWTNITRQVELANTFERNVQGIVSSVAAASTQLAQTAGEMTHVMRDTTQGAQTAADNASQTTMNVQSVASAAEEMSASVQEISSQVQKTNNMANDSRVQTEDADKRAAQLGSASKRVSDALNLIAGIADQINLLALNATIESARAGEAGRGFAVVASEVKNLANQTNKSLEDVAQVIEEMNTASADIIMALQGIKGSVENVSTASASIAAAVEEQSATTNEITRNMQSAAHGTQMISDGLGTVTSSALHASASANQVLGAAEDLSRQSERLNQEVAEFLRMIRS